MSPTRGTSAQERSSEFDGMPTTRRYARSLSEAQSMRARLDIVRLLLAQGAIEGPYRRTPTRRSIAHRVVRLVRMAWLRWKIHANEDWIAIHERQGIHGTANLQQIDLETQVLRVELAIVEAS